MANSKLVYGTDEVWYTIVHRKTRERKGYRMGYRTMDLDTLREIAKGEAERGEYSMVKIINADTDEPVEYFTKAHQ